MINAYAYYLTTCIAGLLVFSCTGPPNLLNKSPLQSSIPHFRFVTEETTIDTGTHRIHIRANEILKYPARVRFIVSGTAFAPRDYTFATKPFVLHTPNYPNHHVKNIIEMPAGTNQIDISLTVKKQLRCEIKTIQLSIENLDDNMETLQLSLKHIPPPCVIIIAGDGTDGSNNGLGTLTQFDQPHGIVINHLGEIYVSDNNHIIRKIKSDGVTTTIVGTPGTLGYSNHGAGSFNQPASLVFDTSNNLYVADTGNHRIRKITPGGVVSTLVGGGTTGTPCPGTTGTTVTCRDGTGSSAQFSNPAGVAVDSAGVVYVADYSNHRIRKITPGGVVSTLAGGGTTGTPCPGTTGTTVTCRDGTGSSAQFSNPVGVVVDSAGVVYVGDTSNHRIRKITPGGVVSTLAGGGTTGTPCPGTTGTTVTCRDGTGSSAQFNSPRGVAVDSTGVVYVADSENHRIRKIITNSMGVVEVSTLAGTGHSDFMDGAGNVARFNQPRGVAVDSVGNVYVGDTSNHRIRKITTKSPTIDPICTNGTPSSIKLFTTSTEKCASCDNGFSLDGELCRKEFDLICTNGTPSTAKVFTASTEKCISCNSGFDLNGNLCGQFDPVECVNGITSTVKVPTANIEKCDSCDSYYALKNDETCAAIMVSTLAGTATGTAGFMDGVGNVAQFNFPRGIAVDGSGNVYVGDTSNHRIRKITTNSIGVVEVSTLAGTGTAGFMDGVDNVAKFDKPFGVVVDSDGNVYVADSENHRIRKVTSTGVVSTLAGTATGTAGFMDGVGNVARFDKPFGVVVDSDGNVYVADSENHRIRKVTSTGVVSTLAGTGTAGFMDGMGNVAKFDKPFGVVVDSDGNVYVADSENHRIRKITSTGVVSTLAGTGIKADGTAGGGFIDGVGNVAQFDSPSGVAVDSDGNVYVADRYNDCIRKITPGGVVSTLAGTGIKADGTAGGGFMDGVGNVAQFDSPSGVVVDSDGNVYVAEQFGHRIRKITIPQ